jgi:hypothetical protein
VFEFIAEALGAIAFAGGARSPCGCDRRRSLLAVLQRRVIAILIMSSAPSGVPGSEWRRRREILAREIERRDLTGQDRDRLERHRDIASAPVDRRPGQAR